MGFARFYHLTHTSLQDTLAALLTRSLDAGLQVDVRGRDPERLAWLDEKLWLGADDGFLPHGLAGGPHDALQPVLLTSAPTCREGTACLMSIEAADVTPAEINAIERTFILFDGNDDDALQAARSQWRALTGAGVVAEYWSQADGPWAMKMRTDADANTDKGTDTGQQPSD